jgi:YD repeat-containing protein
MRYDRTAKQLYRQHLNLYAGSTHKGAILRSRPLSPWIVGCIFLTISILLTGPRALAQTDLTPVWGFNQTDLYNHTDFDSVDYTTGALMVHIPLVSYKQKGLLPPFSLYLRFNTDNWYPPSEQCSPSDELCTWNFYGAGVGIARGDEYTPDGGITLTDGNGNQIGGYPGARDPSGASHLMGKLASGGYISVDNTGIQMSADGFTVIDHSGTKYSLVSNSIYWDGIIETDLYGNSVATTSGGWTDSLGRLIPYPPSIQSFMDLPSTPGCKTIQFPGYAGNAYPISFCFSQVQISTNFQISGITEFTDTLNFLTSVSLPNGTEWSFQYDNYGNIQSITTPLGGTISYTWGTSGDLTGVSPYPKRVILSRTESPDGGATSRTRRYRYRPDQTTVAIVTDPGGNDEVVQTALPQNPNARYQFFYQGQSSNGILLKTIETDFPDCPRRLERAFSRFCLPTSIKTTLANGAVEETDYTYDYGVLITDPDDSTWQSTANVGSVIQQSGPDGTYLTHYLWQDSATYLNANRVDLVSWKRHYQSMTTYTYDEAGQGPQGPYGNATTIDQVDTIYGNDAVTKNYYDATTGNLLTSVDPRGTQTYIQSYQCSGLYPQTVIAAYKTSDTQAETTTMIHDCNTGYTTSATDPNGIVTQYAYDDPLQRLTSIISAASTNMQTATAYSYPSMTEVDQAQDMTAYGDGVLKRTTIYDQLGEVIRQTDSSGNAVDTTYDALGRVCSVSNPHGSSSSSTDGTTYLTYDSLGRKVLQIKPDGARLTWCYNDLATNGQSFCQPNHSAYRATAATWTDFQNESGHVSQQTNDGAGRLIAVIEPSAVNNSLGYETDYSYSLAGDLLNVTQKGTGGSSRIRTFTYDAFNRLICAENPEVTFYSCPAAATGTYVPGSGTVNGGTYFPNVTVGYIYDGDGNLKSKISPLATVNYQYDALNRLLSKTYSNSSVATPSSCYQYDLVANGIGRLGAEWTQAGSCPPVMPTSGFITKRTINSYDVMGRITGEEQCTSLGTGMGSCTSTASNPFSLTYGYDLAGHLTQFTNGVSSILLTDQYNAAGQLSAVTSSWSDPTHPATVFTGTQYSAFGALENWTLGANIFVTKMYDSRLRATGESAVPQ